MYNNGNPFWMIYCNIGEDLKAAWREKGLESSMLRTRDIKAQTFKLLSQVANRSS